MLRAVDVAVTPAAAAFYGPAALAVVIDVLRATSTIVAALESGALGVVPVRDQDEAIAVGRRLGRDRSLLCGERGTRSIAGFDLDNSPASYTPAAVAGKTIVFTTTNGTRALAEAAHGKNVVYCGALINRAAIAERLAASDAGEALLICAGNEGALSFEDFLCAGAIVERLHAANPALALGDAARGAAALYATYAKRMTTAVASGTHAKTLIAAGFANDVASCARVDASTCVPRYAEGVVTAT